jgi:adenylosuccinate synthase
MLDERTFGEAIQTHTEKVNKLLVEYYQVDPLDPLEVRQEYVYYAHRIRPYIDEVSLLLSDVLKRGGRVLAEGAQGALLDLDHGTYPYVTSSYPTAAGALLGLGLGIEAVGRVIGVTKAFQTRVGAGPFPSEVSGSIATRLRGTGENPWDEFGTTTGRPRRVGWLDIPLLRYAVRINGLSELVLTKLDILSGLDTIKLCTAYTEAGKSYDQVPFGPADLSPFEPVYEELSGWNADLRQVRLWEELPSAARAYILRIEQLVGVPIRIISVGPERDQVIVIT